MCHTKNNLHNSQFFHLLNLSRITEEEDSNIKNEDRKKCYIRENVKFYQKLKSPFLKTSAEAFEAGNFPKLLSSLRTIFI